MAYVTPWLEGKANHIVDVYDSANEEWVSLIDPKDLKFNVYDLDSGDSTGRNLEGTLLRDRKAVKEKISMEFPPMLARDMYTMLKLVQDQFFQCRYFSPKTGTTREVTMYVGDRDGAPYFDYDPTDPMNQTWVDVKFNFIER